MPDVHIFQIYYSTATREMLDPGFLALDNTQNARPDWREYWPIRNYLLTTPLVKGDYYGFLSPAFRAKTRLASSTVMDFIRAQGGEPDVVLFSPYYDQMAFFLNQWEQGATWHRNAFVFEESLALAAPDFALYDTVSCARNSVFCNYFVAKADFWVEWLERCEKIFQCAEGADSALGRALSADVRYLAQPAPAKVFIVERMASAILATQPHWAVKAYDPLLLPFSSSPISSLGPELVALDALKAAFSSEPHRMYKKAFFELRARFADNAARKD